MRLKATGTRRRKPSQQAGVPGSNRPGNGRVDSDRPAPKVAERAQAAPGVTATARVAGPYLLLEQISSKLQLDKLLSKCFGEDAAAIQSLVYFLVHKGLALSRSDAWSMVSLHPFSDHIDSRRVSELLRRISEDSRQRFLSMWLKQTLEKDCLCYDITSISSYARSNEYTRYGYNRDGDSLEQINLAMLFGQDSRLPAYYRRMPGNISDVATLKTTVKSLDFLGFGSMHLILDRGFYSASNIDELYRCKHHFTISVPTGRKWIERIIDKHYENIASPTQLPDYE